MSMNRKNSLCSCVGEGPGTTKYHDPSGGQTRECLRESIHDLVAHSVVSVQTDLCAGAPDDILNGTTASTLRGVGLADNIVVLYRDCCNAYSAFHQRGVTSLSAKSFVSAMNISSVGPRDGRCRETGGPKGSREQIEFSRKQSVFQMMIDTEIMSSWNH